MQVLSMKEVEQISGAGYYWDGVVAMWNDFTDHVHAACKSLAAASANAGSIAL